MWVGWEICIVIVKIKFSTHTIQQRQYNLIRMGSSVIISPHGCLSGSGIRITSTYHILQALVTPPTLFSTKRQKSIYIITYIIIERCLAITVAVLCCSCSDSYNTGYTCSIGKNIVDTINNDNAIPGTSKCSKTPGAFLIFSCFTLVSSEVNTFSLCAQECWPCLVP